jgi:tetratricopeptide (TPR) repeat protein
MQSANAPRAFAAIQKAKRLASKATPLEQALIDAMATRFTEVHDPDTRRELDEAYSAAMAKVWETFPQEQVVGTFYGESLMLLQPRRGTWDLDNPEVQHIHRVLEAVLAVDITHPGACHLYVHATESTTAPGKAQACADHLGNAIPGASHINHMPSHTYNRVGRWDEAVQANVQAWHSDLKAEVGEGFAIYPSHNLHMLLFAASMGGQGALANQAAKDYAKLVDDGQFYQALTLVRFGRFDELLGLHDPPENPIFKGLWEFGRGYAHLRVGDRDSARIYAEFVKEAATTVPDSILFRGHTAASLLGVTGGILRAEIQASEGQYDEAVVTLEHAIELEDGLRYDEPEPLNFSARHWLGALLLDLDRPAEAERVYRLALEDHPHNGWSLFGLDRALRAQGREAEANRVRDEFNEVWERADVWIRSSRF